MSYFKLLGLTREPFSTSPDPHFFFLSAAHRAALYRLRIAVSLRRGLCIVLGDVGTGKTTLSRRLAQLLPQDGPIDLHVILNPYFESDQHLLVALMEAFHIETPQPAPASSTGARPGDGDGRAGGPGPLPPVRAMLSAIERHLFARGVEQGRIVTLLIDEAQQLSPSNLELLRALLNYETQDTKLLQLILMAQLECLPTLRTIRNLWDRVSLKYVLNPLDEGETKELITFRLTQAGWDGREPLFTDDAVRDIHYATQGYPRRIALLCHDALERLVMDRQPVVTPAVIRGLIERERELAGVHVPA